MDSKKEEKNEVDLKKIRIDFIKKRLSKNDKNSFDVMSVFYHILSISDDDFVRNSFEKLKDIVSRGSDQQELNSFIEEIKSEDAFTKIKDTDLGEGQTPEKFLNEYGNSLPKFFSDFDKITNKENSLDFETLDYMCSRDMMQEMWPENSEELTKYDKAYINYKDSGLNLEVAKSFIKEKLEDVERYNNGILPENQFEIDQDTIYVAATSGILAFPPLVILSGILFLLKANKNELAEKATKWIAEKKKNTIESTKSKIKEKIEESMNKFTKIIDERKNRAEELKSSLPDAWKKIVDSATPPIEPLYMKLVNLKKHQEQLELCNANTAERLVPPQQTQPVLP